MALAEITETLITQLAPGMKRGFEEILSPERKKEKREHIPKMETLELCRKDDIFVKNSIVLRKLIDETTFAGIKTLINCYNPMIVTDIEMIKKHMLESTGLRGEKADVFKLAIKYVTND
ncbi:MAG: hypothetical protein GY793_10005, partial [Proteobacteria bacterium]|nr:hypothetical protein [Pseudomonadota bacterium]